jgi:hypothetical protein
LEIAKSLPIDDCQLPIEKARLKLQKLFLAFSDRLGSFLRTERLIHFFANGVANRHLAIVN